MNHARTVDHARVLGVAYLVYGIVAGIGVLAAGAALVVGIGMAGLLNYAAQYLLPATESSWLAGGTLAVHVLLSALVLLGTAALAMPFILTGYGLLRHKRWAPTAAVVAIVVLLLTTPVGSVINLALIGYTLWFVFGGARERDEGFVAYTPPSRSSGRV